MGLKFKKSFKVAPGVKVNLNKKSMGVTVGGKHAKVTMNSKGKRTTTISAPGTGLSYSTTSGGTKKKRTASGNTSTKATASINTNSAIGYSSDVPKKSVGVPLPILLAVVGGVAFLFVAFIVFVFVMAKISPNNESVDSLESQAIAASDHNEIEHGTSAYVDYLAFKAKDDAEIASDERLQEAVDWLKNNTTAYFSTEENMEKTMYYGQLLEYKYKGTGNEYEKIGWQAFKTVKYVYREVEDVLDDVTQNNLLELQEMAENLPDIQ